MATQPASLNRLMNNLRVRIPSAIDDALRLELFNVLNVFFKTTKCWKEDIDFVATADEDTYSIDTSEPAQIESLIGVKDSNDIPVTAYLGDDFASLKLGTAPSATATYTATVSLTVTDPVDNDDYPQYPDWLLVIHHDTILDGMLGAMMSQKAKPYSDERLAIFHQRKFRNTMASARVNTNRKNTANAQAWCFPRWT